MKKHPTFYLMRKVVRVFPSATRKRKTRSRVCLGGLPAGGDPGACSDDLELVGSSPLISFVLLVFSFFLLFPFSFPLSFSPPFRQCW
ncbi:hypothetical protein Sjap_019656 [Stephania japonica]|uniref:Transmembrane protein n=1 Tax=Stephania japonica TaxID=461633 RepID=A0AAP0HYC1_9MAGN